MSKDGLVANEPYISNCHMYLVHLRPYGLRVPICGWCYEECGIHAKPTKEGDKS